MHDWTPQQFNILDANPGMLAIWDQAVRELHCMSKAQTPRRKILIVGRAIQIVQHSFELYKQGQSICADDIVKVMPYLIAKAQI
jgi:hypothetical protein